MSPIPLILHQVWLGPSPLPEEFARYRETWQAHHPRWRLELWTEDNLPERLRWDEVRNRLRVPAERADILRLEVLWLYGGVYVDTDFECRRSLEPLLAEIDFFTAYLKPGRVNNAIIGATKGHPILDRALRELAPAPNYRYDKAAAGPLFLDRLVKDYREITIFEPEVFYPATPGERDRAVAIHHAARSWKDSEGFREAANRARRRTAAANAKLVRSVEELELLTERLAEMQALIDRARAGGRVAPARVRRLRRAPRALAIRAVGAARHQARRLGRQVHRSALAFEAAAAPPAARAGRAARRLIGRRTTGAGGAIPRIVHQIWLSVEAVPRELERAQASWPLRNRGWEHRVWTNANLPEGLLRHESGDPLRSPGERSFLLRLELLHRFGGVYADPDVECRRALDDVVSRHRFAAATLGYGAIDDSLLVATPGHPALARLLASYPATEYNGQPAATVASLLEGESDLERLPPGFVADRGTAEESRAAAVRLQPRERGDNAKAAALEAERLLAAAQGPAEDAARAAQEMRRRLQAAEAELERIRTRRRANAVAGSD